MHFPSFHGMNFKNKKGFSFGEVMFAMAIVGSVIVLMMGTLTTGLQALQKGTGYNQATLIAQRTIEMCKSINYTSLAIYDPTPYTTSQEGFVVKLYVKQITATDIVNTSKTVTYKKLTVKVTKATDVGGTTTAGGATNINVTMEAFYIQD